MSQARWQQIEALCHAALERPADERPAFLAAACGEDEDLRREVESLIVQEGAAAGFMSVPAPAMAGLSVLESARGTLVGQQLGAYAIRSLLGVGGMGEVYRAHDPTLGREVAIKVLPAAYVADPERRARFDREARMLATLNHPHIGAIYGVEEAGGVRGLVLELVEGETLAERIARSGLPGRKPGAQASGLSVQEALQIARQIADALESAHEKGIVHRDLKPANIKITPNGAVKVLDFGLAKAAAADGHHPDPAESRVDVILGTATYMSPEQARGQSVDKRSDIWAFGCVLYEMLTGRVAFAGETVADTIAGILDREPDFPALPATAPPAIHRLVRRCLVKDPRRRLRDIGDVRIELDTLDDQAVAGAGASPVGTHASPVNRTWLPWAAVAALVIGITLREVSRAPAIPAASDEPFAGAQFRPLIDWPGVEGGAEISPDGRFVAFVSDSAGEFDLWLVQTATGRATNLTATIPPLNRPHQLLRTFGFNGDGSEIWFSLDGDPIQQRKLLIPLMGGTPRPFLAEGNSSPAWSPDAGRLVYFRGRLRSEPESIGGDPMYIADRIGDNAREILAREKQMHNHNPVWSPDGEWLYYVHGSITALNWTDDTDIWRLRMTGGAPERLTNQKTAVTFLAPLDARTVVYVARDEDGSGPWLWTVDTQTKATRRIGTGLNRFSSVSASRDGRQIAATLTSPAASLWTVPIRTRLAEESDVRPYPVGRTRALAPRFRGASLFFLSSGGTADGLWRVPDHADAAELRRGADGPLFVPPAVSRDGTRVAVVLGKEGRRQLAVMSAEGTGARSLAESIDLQGTADWSPDGTSLVAGGADAKGAALFIIPVDGSPVRRLVDRQALNPIWSPDGSTIVYAGALVPGQVATLQAVRPDGTVVDFPGVRVRTDAFRFLPDGSGIVYITDNLAFDFSLLDLRTKQAKPLTRLGRHGQIGAFDINSDGSQIVFDRALDRSDIVLIERAQK